jgi:hypothetical protein
MTRNFLPIAALAISLVLTTTAWNPSNPPTGNTGGPGETTCAKSGCHNGGTFTGTVSVTGLPDTAFVDSTYVITLVSANNSVRGGFQMTSLNENNNGYGSFLIAPGTNVTSAGGRPYARQSTPKNLTAGSVSWDIKWKAPATVDGIASLYYAVLCANNAGQSSGDNVLTGSTTVPVGIAPEPVGLGSFRLAGFGAYPTLVKDKMVVTWAGTEAGQCAIFDLSGRMISSQPTTAGEPIFISDLAEGSYILQLSTPNGVGVVKFIKQ